MIRSPKCFKSRAGSNAGKVAAGHFNPLIDSIEAYRENYRFRQIMEPAAIRSAEFEVDMQKVESLRAQQEFVRDRGFRTLSQVELFEIHSNFHETPATMSHNRFLVQTLVRLNQLDG